MCLAVSATSFLLILKNLVLLSIALHHWSLQSLPLLHRPLGCLSNSPKPTRWHSKVHRSHITGVIRKPGVVVDQIVFIVRPSVSRTKIIVHQTHYLIRFGRTLLTGFPLPLPAAPIEGSRVVLVEQLYFFLQ